MDKPVFKFFKQKSDEVKLTPEVIQERKSLLKAPVEPVDIEKVASIKDLVDAWKDGGIQSRSLAECAMVYENMLSDKDRPTVMLGDFWGADRRRHAQSIERDGFAGHRGCHRLYWGDTLSGLLYCLGIPPLQGYPKFG